MTFDMFSRLFRTAIQSSIVRSSCRGVPVSIGSIGEKLQHTRGQNSLNQWTSQNRWINSASSIVPLHISSTNSYATLFSPPAATSPLILNGLNIGTNVPTRSIVKFTRAQGKRTKAQTVIKRFYRLNWGIWIRTKAGRHRKLYRRRSSARRRLRQHVFCNSAQSWLLDKMVSPYFRKPKYWVDDPYNPYHTREEFWITRKKPIE